jgi:hypothetical protein
LASEPNTYGSSFRIAWKQVLKLALLQLNPLARTVPPGTRPFEVIRKALPQEREDLYQDYQATLSELCSHYQYIFDRMEANMAAVGSALRINFGHL